MKNKKRNLLFAIVLLIVAGASFFPLDAYISKPGGAYDLAPLVEVIGGDTDDQGSFSLMTISLGKATGLSYVLAQFSDKREVLPPQRVRRSGEDEKEYNLRQKRLMAESQFNAVHVAFQKIGLPVQITYDGVIVMRVLDGSAADGKLQTGDRILKVDDVSLTTEGAFVDYIQDKKENDEILLSVKRNDNVIDNISINLKELPDESGRVGLGIHFEEDRFLTTKPKVEIHTSNIGGPSAGLMFTLEIINQLLDEDLTKGYKIAGTGEMLEDGTVGRIGGAGFKVIAASRQGIEIFFAPDDNLAESSPGSLSNYQEALQMAAKIGTKMKIVPVKTVDDALEYLNSLEPK